MFTRNQVIIYRNQVISVSFIVWNVKTFNYSRRLNVICSGQFYQVLSNQNDDVLKYFCILYVCHLSYFCLSFIWCDSEL